MKLEVSEIAERKTKVLVLKEKYRKKSDFYLKNPSFRKRVLSDMKESGLDCALGNIENMDFFFEKKRRKEL